MSGNRSSHDTTRKVIPKRKQPLNLVLDAIEPTIAGFAGPL
jgi:hypothetical protein